LQSATVDRFIPKRFGEGDATLGQIINEATKLNMQDLVRGISFKKLDEKHDNWPMELDERGLGGERRTEVVEGRSEPVSQSQPYQTLLGIQGTFQQTINSIGHTI